MMKPEGEFGKLESAVVSEMGLGETDWRVEKLEINN